MVYLWDYHQSEIKAKTKVKGSAAKAFLLEREINYGFGKRKIRLSEVKKYWSKLNLLPLRKRLFELLIWKK
ncbi:MAG: hypothetical protein ABH867_01935 [Patescibacteria group bacterium]|nr:hypothetical protein [Patescibacteria group bacterium]